MKSVSEREFREHIAEHRDSSEPVVVTGRLEAPVVGNQVFASLLKVIRAFVKAKRELATEVPRCVYSRRS